VSWALAIGGIILLIILHEFGHFVVAKATGMRVERFFLFFPPKLVSVRRGETEYGIGAIPLGGFVKITGMNPEEVEPASSSADRGSRRDLLTAIESAGSGPNTPPSATDREPLPPELLERAYYNQPVWKRVVTILAGPAMNLLVAFLILFGVSFSLERPTALEVGSIVAGSPADAANKPSDRRLEVGDRIVSIDGVSAKNQPIAERVVRLREQIDSHSCPGEATDGCRAKTPAHIIVLRDGDRVGVDVRPAYNADEERNLIGFSFQGADPVPVDTSVGEAAGRSLDLMWFVTSETVSTFAQIFDPAQREELGSVVGATKVTADAFESDVTNALQLVAIISLSLALINLFPFLPLDGGHVFWSLVEKVRGRRVPFSVMERASVVGFMLVLVIFFIGLSNDIGRLTGEGFNTR
jgi:regulator of sigma E protease